MSELTAKEQANVKTAIVYLRAKFGGPLRLCKALRFSRPTLWRPPTPSVAYRLARLAGVGVDDILTGKYPPPGTCPYCGHRREEEAK